MRALLFFLSEFEHGINFSTVIIFGLTFPIKPCTAGIVQTRVVLA